MGFEGTLLEQNTLKEMEWNEMQMTFKISFLKILNSVSYICSLYFLNLMLPTRHSHIFFFCQTYHTYSLIQHYSCPTFVHIFPHIFRNLMPAFVICIFPLESNSLQ